MQQTETKGDLRLFLGQMLRRPRHVVALAPSSRGLARSMASMLSPETGRVAELGPGTGSLTRAILARGVARENLTLFELNPAFCTRLAALFPGVRIENRPAQEMGAAGLSGLGAVISGLPLLSMPDPIQRAILAASFTALRPGGVFVQFTYGPVPPVAQAIREELGLTWRKLPRVWANLPPATVYIFSQPGFAAPGAGAD